MAPVLNMRSSFDSKRHFSTAFSNSSSVNIGFCEASAINSKTLGKYLDKELAKPLFEKAKQLLAEAGYPNGVGFGSVDLRVNISDIHSAVAEDFSNQIKFQ